MMNYFKKILAMFSRSKVKKDKVPLTILRVWRAELIVIGVLLLAVIVADIWIYRNMVSNEVEISKDKVGTIEVLNKKGIVGNGIIVRGHEDLLNNPSFPLTGNPF